MRSVKSTTLRNLLIACGLITACNFYMHRKIRLIHVMDWGILHLRPNIVNRGMGGLSAAYADPFSVNFTNPASYSQFLSYIEEKTGKAVSGKGFV